ncbi:hypothetical protein N9Y23_09980 [Pseudomonadales bacterium]|nr:hypothetical protein [Pseudomonadales bacterium]
MRWAIDGDIIVYAVGFASNDDPVQYALRSTRTAVENIMHTLTADAVDVHLTFGPDNYRFDIDPNYKGNRSGAPKPVHIQAIREYMVEELGAIMNYGQEADDAMGIAATQHGHGIATLDKDLDGVPGVHYNWKKRSVYWVNPEAADQFFYKQMLTGDATDNIQGLFKRTGVKAMKKVVEPLEYMDDPAEMYAHVKQVYMDAVADKVMSSDESDVDRWLLQQGRCLWIRRKENELWVAP